MLFSQNILTALRGLMANKLRSALTILGIVIGVAAVVALMAIGNGATSSITDQIASNGSWPGVPNVRQLAVRRWPPPI
jgi:putative ABC transport system permease protein